MSEEAKIFRGDHDPAQGVVAVPVAPMPAPAPAKTEAVSEAPPPAAAEPVTPAEPVSAPVVAPDPAPPLNFHLDDSQLFHTPEAVRQRMAQLASVAQSTAHLLDAQAEETERIAKRLKSL